MKILLILALVVGLGGCTSLGLAPAQNTQEQIAYASSGVTAALNTLASATSSGLVSSEEAVKVNAALMAVQTELNTANSDLSSNQPMAMNLLTAATQALAQISSYLACKQAKEATCQLP